MSTIDFDHRLAPLPKRKRIALIAHDGKKEALYKIVAKHLDTFSQHTLYATGTTGQLIRQRTGLPVTCLLSGPLGGDQQIGTMIVEEKLDMLFFLWDPLTAQPHDPDVKALLRIAALYEIPIACNIASAEFLISSTLFGDNYQRGVV